MLLKQIKQVDHFCWLISKLVLISFGRGILSDVYEKCKDFGYKIYIFNNKKISDLYHTNIYTKLLIQPCLRKEMLLEILYICCNVIYF